MHARLTDRRGPRGPRLAVAAVGIALGAAACLLGPQEEDAEPGVLRVGAFALVVLGLTSAWPIRLPARRVRLAVAPGRLVIGDRLGERIVRASDVVGATTTVHDGALTMTLSLASQRFEPVSLAFESEADAERVRAVLAIPHEGTGEIDVPITAPTFVGLGRAMAYVSLAFGLLAFCAAGGDGLYATGMTYGVLALVASLFQLVEGSPARVARAVLRADALWIPGPDGAFAIGYRDVARVASEGGRLEIVTHDGRSHVVSSLLDSTTGAILACHLEAARRRALGEGARRAEVSERLSPLRRRGEPARAWAARLDGLAGLARASGYRSAAISRDDLRAALDDPDLAVELRVAAARLLVEADPSVRIRIADAAASAPSEALSEVYRSFDAPADELAGTLERLDEDDLEQLRRGG